MENKKPILSFTLDKDNGMECVTNGTGLEITAAVFALVNTIYCNFTRDGMGRIFKIAIQAGIADNNSLTWQLDDDQAGKDSHENS